MCQLSPHLEASVSEFKGCPFVLRKLNDSTFMIREGDRFGEYPHIYVRLITQVNASGQHSSVIFINDTGVGTTAASQSLEPAEWNVRTFIEHHFNPDGRTPYLVLLSHCHYDHILGLHSLLNHPEIASPAKALERRVTIISSSNSESFITPYENLMENSLCNDTGSVAPHYQTSIWAGDHDRLIFEHPLGGDMLLPIITLHTPGHTPDTLSWYDTEEKILYVGDALYEMESLDTRAAPWGPERPAPILFPNEGDLIDWWTSVRKLTIFVEQRNKEKGNRVTLAAGHVTVLTDASACLLRVKEFVSKILRDEIEFEELPMKRGERFGLWTDKIQRVDAPGGFCLGAPLRIVQEGRQKIPKAEWDGGLSST